MQKRSNESPMDFEWQTKAPGDITSPFYQLAMEHDHQKKKREKLLISVFHIISYWHTADSFNYRII